MKLENQVVSLELAKELKENGYPQEGCFWWTESVEYKTSAINFLYYKSGSIEKDNRLYKMFVVSTVAELGEALKGYDIPDWCLEEKEWILYVDTFIHGKHDSFDIKEDTEANARARMWLYLKKNNLLAQ